MIPSVLKFWLILCPEYKCIIDIIKLQTFHKKTNTRGKPDIEVATNLKKQKAIWKWINLQNASPSFI